MKEMSGIASTVADAVGEQSGVIRQISSSVTHASDCSQSGALTMSNVEHAAGHATDEFVHENPWKSVGIAAGVGLLLGLLVSRR